MPGTAAKGTALDRIRIATPDDAAAGVDIEAGDRAVELMNGSVWP